MVDNYRNLMDKSMRDLFHNALRLTGGNLPMMTKVIRIILHQHKAASSRRYWQKRDVEVPPFMIASITGSCNLKCKGCYAMKEGSLNGTEMGIERLEEVFSEASELGVSAVLIAGGEPLMRSEILKVTGKFPSMVFPLFTNGTLLNEEIVTTLSKQRNVIPVISIEGYEEDTDKRRGEGVFNRITVAMDKLGSGSIFYGASLTITRSNFDTITSAEFVRSLISKGCMLFFYVEYVPVRKDTDDWVLTEEQRLKLDEVVSRFRRDYPAIFISFPGDEKEYGGCLASGRGFVHINREGGLEPCPFAPYSDTNLKDMTLKQALKSDFLKKVRENHGKLNEAAGGCALWDNREWVQSLLK